MKKCVGKLLAVCVLSCCFGSVYADAEGNDATWATGVRVSTLGIGGEATYKLSDNFRLRLVGQGFNYSEDYTDTDMKYDADLDLFTVGPVVDWHPWGGSFKVSGGLFYNGNDLEMSAQPNSTVKIGDTTYTAAQIGQVETRIDFNTVAPYLGFGWGNAFRGSNWTFNLELGVMYQGKGDLDYSTNGTLANNAAFLADVEKEKETLQDDIDNLAFYPVVSLGVSYSF